MKSSPPSLVNCSSEILLSVLQHLEDDPKTLCALGLASKYLRNLSISFLLKRVDLGSHNNGRVRECEDEIRQEIHAHHGAEYAPPSLLNRQRAFLRFIIKLPNLASRVQSLTWTLIWIDNEGDDLTEIDFHLWYVFSCLSNVRHLDLASLHFVAEEPYVRKTPPKLFPALTHLRLMGWMHRGLVDAIFNALDPTALHTLRLDYLEDEGFFPNGAPMSDDLARMYSHRPGNVSHDINYRESISSQLYERQRTGHASAFPGPMWTALHHLANRSCISLTNFRLTISPFDGCADLRNYVACFDETARFLQNVQETLQSLTIIFGASPRLHNENICGTSRGLRRTARNWHIILAIYFLRKLLPIVEHVDLTPLTSVDLQGFHVIETDECRNMLGDACTFSKHLPPALWKAIATEHEVETHPVFGGYDYKPDAQTLQTFFGLLDQS